MIYKPVIGLEVHVELLTKAKLFCTCPTRFGAEPNTQVCPICLGLPGSLPVLNPQAVQQAVTAALALNCRINERSIFARKHYFYPDLPKGYQITQYSWPLAETGSVDLGQTKVDITRLHLEEDSGKLVHAPGETLVDYNRSGIALAEIVTSPCLESSSQARLFLEALKQILEYAGVSDCRMEEGSLRCDVNISLQPVREDVLGTRTEIKNLNSFGAVEQALDHEIHRQRQLLEAGGKVLQETLRWDEERSQTIPMRSKEETMDYRYLPEPDLLPLLLETSFMSRVARDLPELPRARRLRLIEEYGVSEYDATVLTRTRIMADWFEEVVTAGAAPLEAAHWLTGELARLLKSEAKELPELPFAPGALARLLKLQEEGKISGSAAKDVLRDMFKQGESPDAIIASLDLAQISDESELAVLARKVVADNPASAADYRAGKEKALGHLMGKAMALSRGRANPELVRKLLILEMKK